MHHCRKCFALKYQSIHINKMFFDRQNDSMLTLDEFKKVQCMSVWCAFFFRHSSVICQNRRNMPPKGAGGSERPEEASQQLMPTALPRHARDTPVASLRSCSTVSTTGTAEQGKDSKGPYLAVLRNRRRGTVSGCPTTANWVKASTRR